MKVAVEQVFNGSLAQVAVGGAYDADRINRGRHTGQWNLGNGEVDRFVGPAPLGVANFAESSLGIPSQFVHPVQVATDLFWIFGADAAGGAATRRVQLWTFVPSTGAYTFVGAITLTFPTATAHTVRGLRAILTNITTGTVAVSGTAVTGTGTTWATTTPVCVGSRIGFGSTNPQEITTWFQVQAVGSGGSITLSASAGTIPAGTPYVVQDLMILQATTNATVTNGGLFVVKGLRFEDFQNPATTIPAATTVDRIKAVYWLRDAATVTNTAIGGCAIDDPVSMTEQYVFATDGAAASLRIFRYNFRAPLTLTAGAHTLTGTDIVITGTQAVTGNISQANNGRVATLAHGAGAGVKSLYLFTATRIIRVPIANIANGSTTFIADQMSEVPPGGTNTSIATGGFASLDVASSIDKLVVAGAALGTVYITDYYTGGQQIDRRAGCLTPHLPSSLRDTDSPIFVHSIGSNVPFVWVEDGWLFYIYGQVTTSTINAMTVYPLAADWDYTSDVPNRIVCPKITLGDIPSKFYRVVVNCAENIGDALMGIAPDAFKVQYRTGGIDDNTGSWTDVPQNGDLSGVTAASAIQFGFLFRTAGVMMLPARILSLALIYETEDALPSQYQWNFGDSNDGADTNPVTYGFVQAALFGGALGVHTINIYRADTNALVMTQASTGTTNGVFEHWTGSAWAAGLGSDALNTRRRFRVTGSIPGGVDTYAKLTVA